MSTSDAPDWQQVVTTVSATGDVTDAPDWQRVVVAPGGAPVGGSGLTYLYNAAAADLALAPGASSVFCGISLTELGPWLVAFQVAPYTPTASFGVYSWFAYVVPLAGITFTVGNGWVGDQRNVTVADAAYYTAPVGLCIVDVVNLSAAGISVTVNNASTSPGSLTFLGPASGGPAGFITAIYLG